MNKRLLLSLAVGLSAMTSFAYEVGEYVYTTDAKYKIVGGNEVANGSFANNYDNWSQLTGAAASADFWSVEAQMGPNGQNVLQSVSNAADNDGAYLYQSIPFSAGQTYVVSMKVLAPAAITTSVTENGANYLDVYANGDYSSSKTANRFQQVATSTGIPANEWTEVAFAFTDTITGGSEGGLAIAFGRFDVGTQITDIEVHQVQQVYDTRTLEARIAHDRKLLAEEALPLGHDQIEFILGMVEASLNGQSADINIDDITAMEDVETNLTEAEKAFLDANSYDLIAGGVISSNALWATKLQKASGTYGDWFCKDASGRWFHDPSDSDNVNAAFPGNYALDSGSMGIQKALPAGKYLFQIDAMGVAYYNTRVNNSYYTPNYDVTWTNRLFIGNDTTSRDTLSNLNYKTYYMIADVAEGATAEELNLVAGVAFDGKSHGGVVRYKNPVLRMISSTAAEDVTKFVQDNNKAVQLNAARVMIDSAIVVKPKAEFPWGKDLLQEGIDAAEKDYATLDATESTVLLDNANGDGTTVTVADSLTEVMRNIRGYIQAYYTQNAGYTNLVAAVDNAQSLLDDPVNSNASAATRSALTAAVANANTTIATFVAQTDSLPGDLDKSNELIAALNDAITNFQATTATLANPGSNMLTNASFESGNANGWDTSGSQTDNGRWKFGANANFDTGRAITMWRGNTAFSKNKVVQNVTLTHAGAYVFSNQMYGFNENGGRDGDQTTNSQCFIFAKLVESADSIASISLHTNRNYVDSLGYGATTPEYFAIVYNKTDDTPVEVQVGFDGLNNASVAGGLNTYFLGTNVLQYVGSFASFQTDLETMLKDEMAAAQAALAANPSQASDSTLYINTEAALRNAILAGQSAIDGTTLAYPLSSTVKAPYLQTWVDYIAADAEAGLTENRYVTNKDAVSEKAALEYKALLTLRRAAKNFQGVVTGIKGVTVKEAATLVAPQGVYNIAGQKVANSAENLPAGLYIVNGKKVIIK